MIKVYCYPKIGRAGLGNCMLPWARAVVVARKNCWPVIAPQWIQPRLGAILRREKVKRFYLNDFTNRGYLAGLHKWWILNRAGSINEDDLLAVIPSAVQPSCHSRVIIFEGLKNYFRDIWHDHSIVHDELLRIVSPRILEKLKLMNQPFIAMHVRRGDIMQPGLTAEQLLAKRHYTPLSWFVAAAKTIRQDSGWQELPIYVVSDGHAHELAELLAIPNCHLITLGTAIGDIMLLAKARLLFASAHSTFSMWGSYLGRVPTLYYPGKMDQNIFPPEAGIVEREWDMGQKLPLPI